LLGWSVFFIRKAKGPQPIRRRKNAIRSEHYVMGL
jgi:hypothetical protein